MHINITLKGLSFLDSSRLQVIDFEIPTPLSLWDTAHLSINHAVPDLFHIYRGSIFAQVNEGSSQALKRLLKEGNKLEVEVALRVSFKNDKGSFLLEIDKQRVVGVVKPDKHPITSAWHAYSYKQPTKRLLRRVRKDNFIQGYSLTCITSNREKQPSNLDCSC